MRRADARRSASVMISSSIRWSLAGNDVDWMMKTSEPRTFSWISTKISMSAKRRTHGLGQRQMQPVGDFLGQHGIGIAGDQLDRAVLGRHRRFSSRLAGYDVQHIEKSSGNRRVSMGEEISGRGLGWQPVAAVFPTKNGPLRDFSEAALLGAVAKRGDAGRILGGCGASALATAGPRGGPGREQALRPGFR